MNLDTDDELFSGAIPMVTATVYCAPFVLRYGALAVYCLGSILGLYKVLTSNTQFPNLPNAYVPTHKC